MKDEFGPSDLVPYAPDFTPTQLGRNIGEDQVLAWLLRSAASLGSKELLREEIIGQGLSHIRGEKNREDMARHVILGLEGYHLVEGEGDVIALTPVGKKLMEASLSERDRLFGIHILSNCGGLRLVDEIRRIELRGRTPTMEELAFLDRHRTSKSLSTMRAWLARAGVLSTTGTYSVREEGLADLMGERTSLLFGLSVEEAEFLFAARSMMLQTGEAEHTAAQAADLAETRNPDIHYRRKALGRLLSGLESRDLLERTGKRSGRGGSKLTFRLKWDGIILGEEELRGCLEQAGFLLTSLEPLAELLERLDSDSTYEQGRAGEMLAIHVCLILGLRNVVWRKRAPHSEIDLVADRAAGLAYQRWAVQVKNTTGAIASDRVDREIGAASGTGVTHVLFVAPRAGLSRPALAEAIQRSRLTRLHVLYLDENAFADRSHIVPLVLQQLQAQTEKLVMLKRDEAERREGLG